MSTMRPSEAEICPTSSSIQLVTASLRPKTPIMMPGSPLLVRAPFSPGLRETAHDSEIMTRIRLKWNGSRGMPPIFGFLGKVTSQGKKALVNSIVLLVINIVFISCSALALSTIEHNVNNRVKAMNDSINRMGDLVYFLALPANHDRNRSVFPNHAPGHQEWGVKEWDQIKYIQQQRCFKIDNKVTQANLWNFWSSFDFCATVLTTIGYGSMSPRTTVGKWFCICYSIVGIPIMAMYLALFSRGILTIVTASINAFSVLIAKLNAKFRLTTMVARVYSLVFLLLVFVGFVVMWSAILNKTNPTDSMIKCIYFYVITTTTVGLGDISMTEATPTVLIRVLFLFCVGLTLVTSVFNALRSVSAAHTKMLKEAGKNLKTKAQDAMLDGVSRMRQGNADNQLTPLTKDDEDSYDSDQIKTTIVKDKTENDKPLSDTHYYNNGGSCDPDRIETTFTIDESSDKYYYTPYYKQGSDK